MITLSAVLFILGVFCDSERNRSVHNPLCNVNYLLETIGHNLWSFHNIFVILCHTGWYTDLFGERHFTKNNMFLYQHLGTTFQSNSQIWGKSLSSWGLQPGIGVSTLVLFTYHFPLILGISYVGRVRFRSIGIGLGQNFQTGTFFSRINKICWWRNMSLLTKSWCQNHDRTCPLKNKCWEMVYLSSCFV